MCSSKEATESGKKKPDIACDAGSGSKCSTPPPKKKFKCTVEFRPLDSWVGEYGFDWMRIGGPGEKAGEDVYKNVIDSGNGGLNAAQAYTALKTEYSNIPIEIKVKDPEDLAEYFVPYLNLFPKDTPAITGVPAPPSQAELKVLVSVEENAPEKIEFEYDKALFELSKDKITDTAVGTKRVASDGSIKITCKTGLDSDKLIKVWATLEGEKKLVGQLKVMKNDASARKKTKIVFVNVETNINGTVYIGSVAPEEKTFLINMLHQALIQAELEDCPHTLDLTANDDFRIKTVASAKVYGKCIYKKPTGSTSTNLDGKLNEDMPGDAFFSTLRTAFFNDPKHPTNSKYNTGYITIFAFKEIPYDVTNHGQSPFGSHNVAVFEPAGGRVKPVLAHECGHGINLNHPHDSPSATNKYIFKKNKTDNIMSYSFFNTPRPTLYTTWHTQWSIMQSTL